MIDEDKKDDELLDDYMGQDDELDNGWMREDAEEHDKKHDEDISERLNINEIWQDCITPLMSEVQI